jgi:IS30 family transposase
MINISERPPEVEDRAVPGHWEGDLVTGTEDRSAIGTLVERTTGFVVLLHLPVNQGAVAVQDAVSGAVADLPAMLRKTLTWDQGIEMANHTKIAAALAWRSTSATRTRAGKGATTRTPTACCVSTSPRAPTFPSTAPASSNGSRSN